MALDADEAVVASTGHVYVAPVATPGPTDLTTALAGEWLELGFTSEDGVSVTPGVDLTEIMAWQSKYPIRRIENTRSLEVSFSLMQWNEATLPFALGGGTVSTATEVHTYTPPTADQVDERAMVIEWSDGAKDYRMHILRGMVSDLGGFTLARGDAASLDVTFSVLAESEVAPFTILSNDPAWAVA